MKKSTEKELLNRANNDCELCGNTSELFPYHVDPMEEDEVNSYVALCNNCKSSIDENEGIGGNEWRFLSDSMWSEVPSIKILSYRLLQDIEDSWAQEALEMLYIEDDLLELAKANKPQTDHYDSTGKPLYKGDTVTLIKDLDVKGSSLVAKRGTAVRNIGLVYDDPSHISGKVEGQSIYIKTEFVKK